MVLKIRKFDNTITYISTSKNDDGMNILSMVIINKRHVLLHILIKINDLSTNHEVDGGRYRIHLSPEPKHLELEKVQQHWH